MLAETFECFQNRLLQAVGDGRFQEVTRILDDQRRVAEENATTLTAVDRELILDGIRKATALAKAQRTHITDRLHHCRLSLAILSAYQGHDQEEAPGLIG